MALRREICISVAVFHLFWARWLREYHGEADLGLTPEMGATETYRYLWVDQDLKCVITGQR